MPASRNETTRAGPDSLIASPTITKMPVPMIAPMPSAVRSSAPTVLLSCVPSAVSLSASRDLVLKGPGFATLATCACLARVHAV
jgi:hypothetical protein